VKVDANADIAGIRPQDFLGKPTEFEIVPTTDDGVDCLAVEPRAMKKGKGSFNQFTLFLKDKTGVRRTLQYLMERDIAPLSKAWGEESSGWIGNKIVLDAREDVRDGKTYTRPVLKPAGTAIVEEAIAK